MHLKCVPRKLLPLLPCVLFLILISSFLLYSHSFLFLCGFKSLRVKIWREITVCCPSIHTRQSMCASFAMDAFVFASSLAICHILLLFTALQGKVATLLWISAILFPYSSYHSRTSDRTAVREVERKEQNACLHPCSYCCIVRECFAAVHTKETSVISYAVILTAWTNTPVFVVTRLLLKHTYKCTVSKWKLGCTKAAKGAHAN